MRNKRATIKVTVRENPYLMSKLLKLTTPLALALIFFSGCEQKKVKTSVPPPPTKQASQKKPNPTPPATTGGQSLKNAPGVARASRPLHRRKKRPVNSARGGQLPRNTQQNAPPPKTSVPAENQVQAAPRLSPGGSSSDGAREKESTTQLLEATMANLNSLTRPLNSDEKQIVAQIHEYVNQSKEAAEEGDMVRAHNLAIKGNLLSKQLIER